MSISETIVESDIPQDAHKDTVRVSAQTHTPILWKVHHGFNKVRDFTLASGAVVDVAFKYSLYHLQDSLEDALEMPITVVHPALTGTSRMFAHNPLEIGDGQKKKDWGDHLLSTNKFFLRKTSILVVEPIACNSCSRDKDFPCSAEELHQKYGKLEYHPIDTVNLTNQLLADLNERGRIDSVKVISFSLGGSFIPYWLEQEQTKVEKIYSVYSGYNIPDFAREYWQIQVDLLPIDTGECPELSLISQRLLNNFGLEKNGEYDKCFDQIVLRVAQDIEDLKTIYDEEGLEVYMQEALKVCRKVSFLRFQTREYFNRNIFDDSLRFIDAQGNNFIKGMKARNYVALVNNILALPENSKIKLHQKEAEIYSISCKNDMLYLIGEDSLPGVPLTKSIVHPSIGGHDTFLKADEGHFLAYFNLL